jgi:hypothetical protein
MVKHIAECPVKLELDFKALITTQELNLLQSLESIDENECPVRFMPISFKDPSIMLPCNTYFIKIVSAIRH